LEQKITRGDLLITLGAGDVWKIADEFLARNESRRSSKS
jgi:UDP-N-acetylmuramate-alanine ligase